MKRSWEWSGLHAADLPAFSNNQQCYPASTNTEGLTVAPAPAGDSAGVPAAAAAAAAAAGGGGGAAAASLLPDAAAAPPPPAASLLPDAAAANQAGQALPSNQAGTQDILRISFAQAPPQPSVQEAPALPAAVCAPTGSITVGQLCALYPPSNIHRQRSRRTTIVGLVRVSVPLRHSPTSLDCVPVADLLPACSTYLSELIQRVTAEDLKPATAASTVRELERFLFEAFHHLPAAGPTILQLLTEVAAAKAGLLAEVAADRAAQKLQWSQANNRRPEDTPAGAAAAAAGGATSGSAAVPDPAMLAALPVAPAAHAVAMQLHRLHAAAAVNQDHDTSSTPQDSPAQPPLSAAAAGSIASPIPAAGATPGTTQASSSSSSNGVSPVLTGAAATAGGPVGYSLPQTAARAAAAAAAATNRVPSQGFPGQSSTTPAHTAGQSSTMPAHTAGQSSTMPAHTALPAAAGGQGAASQHNMVSAAAANPALAISSMQVAEPGPSAAPAASAQPAQGQRGWVLTSSVAAALSAAGIQIRVHGSQPGINTATAMPHSHRAAASLAAAGAAAHPCAATSPSKTCHKRANSSSSGGGTSCNGTPTAHHQLRDHQAAAANSDGAARPAGKRCRKQQKPTAAAAAAARPSFLPQAAAAAAAATAKHCYNLQLQCMQGLDSCFPSHTTAAAATAAMAAGRDGNLTAQYGLLQVVQQQLLLAQHTEQQRQQAMQQPMALANNPLRPLDPTQQLMQQQQQQQQTHDSCTPGPGSSSLRVQTAPLRQCLPPPAAGGGQGPPPLTYNRPPPAAAAAVPSSDFSAMLQAVVPAAGVTPHAAAVFRPVAAAPAAPEDHPFAVCLPARSHAGVHMSSSSSALQPTPATPYTAGALPNNNSSSSGGSRTKQCQTAHALTEGSDQRTWFATRCPQLAPASAAATAGGADASADKVSSVPDAVPQQDQLALQQCQQELKAFEQLLLGLEPDGDQQDCGQQQQDVWGEEGIPMEIEEPHSSAQQQQEEEGVQGGEQTHMDIEQPGCSAQQQQQQQQEDAQREEETLMDIVEQLPLPPPQQQMAFSAQLQSGQECSNRLKVPEQPVCRAADKAPAVKQQQQQQSFVLDRTPSQQQHLQLPHTLAHDSPPPPPPPPAAAAAAGSIEAPAAVLAPLPLPPSPATPAASASGMTFAALRAELQQQQQQEEEEEGVPAAAAALQGLDLLWTAAEQAHGDSAGGHSSTVDPGSVEVAPLLLLWADSVTLDDVEQTVRQAAGRAECRQTIELLKGLQQLLSLPVVGRVLGEQQQQETLSGVSTLVEKCEGVCEEQWPSGWDH